jgi:hypothetical protein
MASTSPRSATRVIRKALAAPARAGAVCHSCPISRYEHTPMTSQPTSSTHRFLVPTTAIIATRNTTMISAYER